jgi:RimJ/RimL family protein N-acetyltransferase
MLEGPMKPFATAPSLATERLLFRAHRVEDFDDSKALWGDPIVTRHIGGRPFTSEEVWSRLLRYAGHWALLGFGYWVVVEKASNRFVGEVGFADYQRNIEPSFGGAPECGWVIAPWAHGKGYATEAVHAVLAWIDGVHGAARTVCIIDPGNTASRRVAAKCGYREVTETTYAGGPTVFCERLRPSV